MDFSSAINQMTNGTAARTPLMNGYVKREDYVNNEANASLFTTADSTDVVEAVYQITFVENPTRTGGADPTQFSFTARSIRHSDGSLDRVVVDLTDTDTMSVDAEFLRAMISRDWDVFDLATVQNAISARTTGRW